MIDDLSPALRQDIQQALLVIRQGGVVAFPTETYYGLAVDPFNAQALDRLFRLKKRPAAKPLLVLIDQPRQLPRLAADIPDLFLPLMDRYWPGPLTLIFPARPGLPLALTAGTGTVGVRISSHPLACCLCALAGGVITATSANLSGQAPAASEHEVLAQFGARLDGLLKAGPTQGGPASTIVAATPAGLTLIRQGGIPFREVEMTRHSVTPGETFLA